MLYFLAFLRKCTNFSLGFHPLCIDSYPSECSGCQKDSTDTFKNTHTHTCDPIVFGKNPFVHGLVFFLFNSLPSCQRFFYKFLLFYFLFYINQNWSQHVLKEIFECLTKCVRGCACVWLSVSMTLSRSCICAAPPTVLCALKLTLFSSRCRLTPPWLYMCVSKYASLSLWSLLLWPWCRWSSFLIVTVSVKHCVSGDHRRWQW